MVRVTRDDRGFWRQVARQAASYHSDWLRTGYLGTDTWFNEYWMHRTQNSVLKLVSRPQVKFVLDVGCGIGQWSTLMSERLGYRIVGVDFVNEMLRLAKLRTRHKQIDASFCHMSASDLGARERTFDLVLSITVLQHIFNAKAWKRAVSEMLRVTKNGGWIITADVAPIRWDGDRVAQYSYIRTENEYVHEFESNGATLIETFIGESLLDRMIGFANRMLMHYAARIDRIDLQQFSDRCVRYRPWPVLLPCLLVLTTARLLDSVFGVLKKPHEDSLSKFFVFRKTGVACEFRS